MNLYVAIDSVSGLDFLPPPPANIAIAAARRRPHRPDDQPGVQPHDARTYAEVSYRCVPLVASRALPAYLCIGVRKSADWRDAARGVGVRLPGFLLDGLAEDARSGVEAFDVTLKRVGADEEPGILAMCGVRRVGDAVEKCDTESYRFKKCFRSTKHPL
ncbi:hypothetical protein BRADI_2g10550v3 [Brachypodium distachyon]|uniref:Uncharacterized protein n=1 Tax=Brachypodium distachyon TaxID=15368 RepID=A0A0Q3FZU3_BRADI|nr:hypothetical protein BRADI_2g10550v3 [Brachypodium distachyon]